MLLIDNQKYYLPTVVLSIRIFLYSVIYLQSKEFFNPCLRTPIGMERLMNLIAIKYNPSIYNYWYHSEDNSTHLLYNTYTGALVSVLNSDLTDVLSLLENPNDIILR